LISSIVSTQMRRNFRAHVDASISEVEDGKRMRVPRAQDKLDN
jgi:hypothetical protein